MLTDEQIAEKATKAVIQALRPKLFPLDAGEILDVSKHIYSAITKATKQQAERIEEFRQYYIDKSCQIARKFDRLFAPTENRPTSEQDGSTNRKGE